MSRKFEIAVRGWYRSDTHPDLILAAFQIVWGLRMMVYWNIDLMQKFTRELHFDIRYVGAWLLTLSIMHLAASWCDCLPVRKFCLMISGCTFVFVSVVCISADPSSGPAWFAPLYAVVSFAKLFRASTAMAEEAAKCRRAERTYITRGVMSA